MKKLMLALAAAGLMCVACTEEREADEVPVGTAPEAGVPATAPGTTGATTPGGTATGTAPVSE